MRSWFSRSSRSQSSAKARQVRPWLEALESRYCPAHGSALSNVLSNVAIIQHTAKSSEVEVNHNPLNSGAISGGVQGQRESLIGSERQAFGETKATEALTHSLSHHGSNQQVTANDDDYDGPIITNFTAAAEGHMLWTLSGTVTANNPGNVTVSFTGLQTLQSQNYTVQCDSNGNFTLLIQLSNSPNDTGCVTATACDSAGDTFTYEAYVYNTD